MNNGALHIISTPCVLHRYALASKALLEFLKVFLKHSTECVNFITAWAHVFKVLYKDELNVPNSHVAIVTFTNFGVDWTKGLQCY